MSCVVLERTASALSRPVGDPASSDSREAVRDDRRVREHAAENQTAGRARVGSALPELLAQVHASGSVTAGNDAPADAGPANSAAARRTKTT